MLRNSEYNGPKSCTIFSILLQKGWDHGISVEIKQINITDGLYCCKSSLLYHAGGKQNEDCLHVEPRGRVEKEHNRK